MRASARPNVAVLSPPGRRVQDTFSDTVAWLRGNSVKADAVFLVPEDRERLRQPRSRIRDGVPPEEESLSTRDSTRAT
jgi:hypothetical protein